MNRRDFLRKALGGAAGVVAAKVLPESAGAPVKEPTLVTDTSGHLEADGLFIPRAGYLDYEGGGVGSWTEAYVDVAEHTHGRDRDWVKERLFHTPQIEVPDDDVQMASTSSYVVSSAWYPSLEKKAT